MTLTPPSATSSSTGQSPDGQFRVVRKRNRVPLSCAPCRHRKLKCNRGHPCDNCTKRGDMGSCTYASPGSRKKSQSGTGASGSADDMQNRIDRLESLVLSLMTNGPQSAGPSAAAAAIAGSISSGSNDNAFPASAQESIPEEDGEESEVEQVAKSIGVMKVDNSGKSMFASEAHWYAILGEIAEVKNYFADHKKQYEDQLRRLKESQPADSSPGTAWLFGLTKRIDHEDILAAFPPRQTADLLITRYFNTYDPILHIIHGPTFQRQYDQHWLNPAGTPVMWLGLCAAMMCIALQSYSRAGDEPPEYRGQSWQMSSDYRQLTAQCLMLADTTLAPPQMLETLILHTYAEHARSHDAEMGVNTSVTMFVRLAMRMGYHRDPAPYSVITPFQAEMRRRIWTVVRRSDLLFNAQWGLPPVIRPRDTNVALPRNIYDDELYEEMTSLPPSRPTEEVTPASYIVANARLINLLGEIIDDVQGFSNTSYEEIMKYDQRLKELQASLPPHLLMRSMKDSARDSTNLILQRFSVDLLYLKSVVTLHRKFLAQSRVNSRFAYSRRACLDASMKVLEHQGTLHHECLTGGRLRSVKWFVSSLTSNDFLLAGMITCLDLYHTMQAENAGRSPPGGDAFIWTSDRREEMFHALRQSIQIWETQQNQSMEAYKASTTLRVMCSTLKSQNAFGAAAAAGAIAGPTGYGTPGTTAMDEDPNVAPEHSAAMTLGMLSSGGGGGGGGGMSSAGGGPTNPAALFESSRGAYPSPNSAAAGGGPPMAQPVRAPSSGIAPGFGLAAAGVPTPQDFSGFASELRKATGGVSSPFGGGGGQLFGAGSRGGGGGGGGGVGGGFGALDPAVAGMGGMNGVNATGAGGGGGGGGQEFNWEAFDSFIQGSSALDPGAGMWGLDMGGMAAFGGDGFGLGPVMGHQQQQQQQGGQGQGDGVGGNPGGGGS